MRRLRLLCILGRSIISIRKGECQMAKIRPILLTLVVNGLLPFLIYIVLSNYVASFTALSIATIIPLFENIQYLIKHKKVDVFSSIMLFTFILSLVLIAFGGSEKLLLIRESFITAGVGLIFIGSLLFPKPLIYHLALRFTVKDDAKEQQSFANKWSIPYFRHATRNITSIWGLSLLLEAVVRVYLVFSMSTAAFLVISNFVLYGFIGLAILFTALYRKRVRTKLNRLDKELSVNFINY